MGEKKSFVKDYMTKNVISVSPDTETQKYPRNGQIQFQE